jgi:hypothetical protein
MCGHSFHPITQGPRARGPRFWRNGRVGFGFLAYTISEKCSTVRKDPALTVA